MDREKVMKLQHSQLSILLQVDQYCKNLGIDYFLAFGSLLGAIRHSGPIPWDADIDIVLFRSDYEKLRKYCISNNGGRYFYSDYTTDKNHISPHALLIDKQSHIIYSKKKQSRYNIRYDGVYIDIFPMDQTSIDIELRKKQAQRIMKIKRLIRLKLAAVYVGKTNLIEKGVKFIISDFLRPLSFQYLGKLLSKEQQKYNVDNSGLYVIPADDDCFNRVVTRDYYYPVRKVLYDEYTVSIPNKAEKILEQRYGEYMILPPVDERWNYFDAVIEDVVLD